MKVSIVLPTYNGERFIKESIESIIYQTMTDWELIIVNDCSTDGTEEILKEYARKDTRIKVIHNTENMRLPKSLNIGFHIAEGDYFTWTSDDNIFLPNALEKMVRYLDKDKKCMMVAADMANIDVEGKPMEIVLGYDEKNIWKTNSVGACFLYRNSVKAEIGDYDPELFCVEDYDYWLRVIEKYGHIEHIPDTLYLYRCHEQSLTSTKKDLIKKQKIKLFFKHRLSYEKLLKKDPSCLYYLYESLYLWESIEYRKIFGSYFPFIYNEQELDEAKKMVLFGAGKVGKKALSRYKKYVKYFIDNDKEKEGTYIDEVQIVSIDDLYDLEKEYQMVISVGDEKKYEIINQLLRMGIKQYCIFR